MADDQFIERFEVTYTGTVGDLETAIEGLTGVDGAVPDERSGADVDTTLGVEITFDTLATDRSTLAAAVESIDGVENVST